MRDKSVKATPCDHSSTVPSLFLIRRRPQNDRNVQVLPKKYQYLILIPICQQESILGLTVSESQKHIFLRLHFPQKNKILDKILP